MRMCFFFVLASILCGCAPTRKSSEIKEIKASAVIQHINPQEAHVLLNPKKGQAPILLIEEPEKKIHPVHAPSSNDDTAHIQHTMELAKQQTAEGKQLLANAVEDLNQASESPFKSKKKKHKNPNNNPSPTSTIEEEPKVKDQCDTKTIVLLTILFVLVLTLAKNNKSIYF